MEKAAPRAAQQQAHEYARAVQVTSHVELLAWSQMAHELRARLNGSESELAGSRQEAAARCATSSAPNAWRSWAVGSITSPRA